MNIFISNLSFQSTDDDLRGLFCKFGEVFSAQVIRNKANQRSRGIGYVVMPLEIEADKALAGLNNKQISGRTLYVTKAIEPYTPSPWEKG